MAAYLLLGLVFITLGVTVFYDIPQLNLGSMLQQQKDLHIPRLSETTTTTATIEEEQTEATGLRTSFGKFLGKKKTQQQQQQQEER